MSNPKSLLGEWSQAHGKGPFQSSFMLSFDVVGEQLFRARITFKDTGEEMLGEPSVGKKATERSACEKMYRHVMSSSVRSPPQFDLRRAVFRQGPEPCGTDDVSSHTGSLPGLADDMLNLPGVDPKSLLGEWSQARGEGSFTIAFELTFTKRTEQRFCASLLHKSSGHITRGAETVGKRETEKQACESMYLYLKNLPEDTSEGLSTAAVGGHSKRNYTDAKSKLGEWSQRRGQGPFAASFKMSVERLDEQVFQATVLHVESQYSVTGACTTGKKGSEQDACQKMYDHLVKTIPEMPDSLADLHEPFEHGGQDDFFRSGSLAHGGLLRDSEVPRQSATSHFVAGYGLSPPPPHSQMQSPTPPKTPPQTPSQPQPAAQAAAKPSGDPKSAARTAWFGEKVLELCFVLKWEGSRLSADRLRERLTDRTKPTAVASLTPYCNLEETGDTERDAAAVKAHVWQTFLDSQRDITKTKQTIQELLE